MTSEQHIHNLCTVPSFDVDELKKRLRRGPKVQPHEIEEIKNRCLAIDLVPHLYRATSQDFRADERKNRKAKR